MSDNYPDWVLKYKQKGTYINKVKEKYYLYAAHSERIKGTNKVRRVSDGYLGRITETDGLIPPNRKSFSTLISYEFGNSYVIFLFTGEILEGMCRSFPKNGRLLYVCSILNFIYGLYSKELFEQSCLHILFPDVVFPAMFPDNQLTAIMRGTRMLEDRMATKFGPDTRLIMAVFSNVRLIRADRILYCSKLSPQALEISKKYDIRWENELWQK